MINKDNLAYMSALFPESELMREQLLARRSRPKQPPTPGITDTSYSSHNVAEASMTYSSIQQSSRASQSFVNLLSTDVIVGQKDQVLFLLVLVSLFSSFPSSKYIQPLNLSFLGSKNNLQ